MIIDQRSTFASLRRGIRKARAIVSASARLLSSASLPRLRTNDRKAEGAARCRRRKRREIGADESSFRTNREPQTVVPARSHRHRAYLATTTSTFYSTSNTKARRSLRRRFARTSPNRRRGRLISLMLNSGADRDTATRYDIEMQHRDVNEVDE